MRGSLADGDLIGSYLCEGELRATLAVGQDDETESRLEELLRAKARPAEAARLGDPGVAVDEIFTATASS